MNEKQRDFKTLLTKTVFFVEIANKQISQKLAVRWS